MQQVINEQPASDINSVAADDNKNTATQTPQQTENNSAVSHEPVAELLLKKKYLNIIQKMQNLFLLLKQMLFQKVLHQIKMFKQIHQI